MDNDKEIIVVTRIIWKEYYSYKKILSIENYLLNKDISRVSDTISDTLFNQNDLSIIVYHCFYLHDNRDYIYRWENYYIYFIIENIYSFFSLEEYSNWNHFNYYRKEC